MFSFEHLSKNVESGLYAATVKGILLYHLNVTKRLVTYGNLAAATAGLPKGGQLAQALERIAEDDHLNKRHISTAIVVNEKTGLPGAGFFNQCRSLGHPVPKSPEGELLFWKQLLNHLNVLPFGAAFDFDGMGAGIDPALKEAAAGKDIHTVGEVGILAGIWSSPEAGDRKPVPDISLHPEIKAFRDKAASTARERIAPRAFPHIQINPQEEKVVGTVKPGGMGVHRTPESHRFRNNPASCGHANEVPHVCKCYDDCYCKGRTCPVPGTADKELESKLIEEAILREKELNQQVDREEEVERRTIVAKDLKEGDEVVLFIESGQPCKVVKVATVTLKLMIESQSKPPYWAVNWTDTEGVQYGCFSYTHLLVKGAPPPVEKPASKLP